jgi:hypothetical protein
VRAAAAPWWAFVQVVASLDSRDGRRLELSYVATSEGVEVATATGTFVEVERPG